MKTRALALLGLAALSACGGGGRNGTDPLPIAAADPEIVFARSRRDNPHNFTGLYATSWQNQTEIDLTNRAGIERDVRVDPSGERFLFTRERTINDPESREIYSARVDRTIREERLTANGDIDETPCWSPDGTAVAFVSTRGATGLAAGIRRLWRMTSRGTDVQLVAEAGDDELLSPDWARDETDRIVFSRIDASTGLATLWLVNAAAGGAGPLVPIVPSLPPTAVRGGGGDDADGDGPLGDVEPAFSPDGRTVAFIRRTSAERSQLHVIDLATGVVTPLGDGGGRDGRPRFTPTADRILVLRERLDDGIDGGRVFSLLPDGTRPVLLFPDRRFDYPGFDVLPDVPARPSTQAPMRIDLEEASGRLDLLGAGSLGRRSSILERDGDVLGVATFAFEGRERAGIDVRVPLGVQPDEFAYVEVTVTAGLSRVDEDSILRLAIDNPVDSRFDTVVEVAPTAARLDTYSFATSSLANVTRDREIRLEVIADLSPGDRAELFVDAVEVTLVRIEPPPAPPEPTAAGALSAPRRRR